jgi:hypothetical protein
MIFKDLIEELNDNVAAAVNELFSAAYANQTHPQDLLLVDQHGFHNEPLAGHRVAGQPRVSPYMLGPDLIGFAEHTFYKFIDWYRKSHLVPDRAEFEKQLAEDPQQQIHEDLFLQIEQGIYLRFWESDLILKRLHQLSSLCVGEPYDWFLKIPDHPRGRIIRDGIRDRVKDLCPAFYVLVKENYKSQVRNAIAHSQYYIIGRQIGFLNHSEALKAHAPLRGMSFDEWYTMFHTTLLLHNHMTGAFCRHRERYKQQTVDNGNRIEIRITLPKERGDEGASGAAGGAEEFQDLAMRPNRDEWVWRKNLGQDDPPGSGGTS